MQHKIKKLNSLEELDYQISLTENTELKDTEIRKELIYYYDERNFVSDIAYYVKDGIYTFLDKPTMIEFMYKYGITCGCERRLVNGRIKFFYNNIEMTEQQYNFLRNRAIQLKYTINPDKRGCGCDKKRQK